MNNRIHTTIILAAAAFAACSGLERADIVPATKTSRIMLVREGAADVSVYAFRRQGAVFLFDTLFREGWTPDGKLSVRMPNGHYKFLFASGAADRIALQPAPLTRQTSWEEASFVLLKNAVVPGTCFPADELFLQYPASDANTVYTIDGAAQTVRARLTRAVCRISVTVKRGYHDGTRYVEVPYAKPQSVLDQIGRIARAIDEQQICGPSGDPVRIEMFAHGALCMAVSGKCYLSLHETGCSANRGACRQICRRKYTLTDVETGAQLAAEGQYLLSPKDLCTIDFLDRFVGAGVRVLKIEGRARGAEYVRRVVACYDRALRAMETGEYTPELAAALKEELATVFNRGFWQGYYAGAPMAEHSEHYGSSATRRKVYVGRVTNFFKKQSVAEVWVEASPVRRGDELFFQGPTTGVVELTADPYVGNAPAQEAVQGVFCSLKTPSLVRRGDQLYRMVPADASNSQPD